MLKTTSPQGFHMTFANGWNVSVQFGEGHYCSRRFSKGTGPSHTAEVAVWHNSDPVHENPNDDGWQTAEQVAKLLAKVAKWKSPVQAEEDEAYFDQAYFDRVEGGGAS